MPGRIAIRSSRGYAINMRAVCFVLLLGAGSHGPAWAEFSYDPAKSAVLSKDNELKRAEDLARWAEEMKAVAAQKALTAKQRADMARRRRKQETLEAAARAKEEFTRAEQNAAAKKEKVNSSSLGYLQAEDKYYAQNGTYVKPQQYQYLKEKLRYESARTQTPAAGPSDNAITEQHAELQSRLESGKPVGAGELAARAAQIKQLGYGTLKTSLNTDYSGGLREATGQGADASARGTASVPRAAPDMPRSETATLLRTPLGDMGRAASKRFTSAGRDSLELGNAKEALLAAEEAIRADPQNPNAWGLKADALNSMGRFGEGEAAAQRAVDLDPNNAKGLRALVWAQLHNGKAKEAAGNATRLILLDPENAESFLLRAFAYELGGDRARMMADLRQAASLDPRFANHLARAMAGQRLFDPDRDNSALLGMLGPPLPGPARIPWGLLALLVGAGGAAWKFRLRVPALYHEWFAPKRTVGAGRSAPRPTGRPVETAADDSLLAGKYRRDQVVGRGGMGRVWKAFDISLEREVAVKEMSLEAAGKPAMRALYLKEARALASLQHANLVEIFEVIETPEQIYIVMEWVSGKTMHQVLVEKGPLSLEMVKPVILSVCDGLAAAHAQGMVHRDLKPANLMVSSAGRVKLIDFGIAHVPGEKAALSAGPAAKDAEKPSVITTMRTRTLAGTPAYCPPETKKGLISPAFDVFSLGVCVYELLTGKLPFGPDGISAGNARFVPASTLVPGLPAALDNLLEKSLAEDINARTPSVAAFRDTLKSI